MKPAQLLNDASRVVSLAVRHPATADHPDTTTAFLAAITGHWHRNARNPAPPPDCAPTGTAPPPASLSSVTA